MSFGALYLEIYTKHYCYVEQLREQIRFIPTLHEKKITRFKPKLTLFNLTISCCIVDITPPYNSHTNKIQLKHVFKHHSLLQAYVLAGTIYRNF
jgi:hypothetical protein